MEIIEKRIEELIPYENNPRKNETAVEYVANSIKEFGFKVPIIIDKNNVVVAGHTRLKAAKMLKLDVVPCVVADSLSDEQVKAFRLVDNKTAEIAEWDNESLGQELDSLADKVDMKQFGFIEDESLYNDDFYTDAEPKEKSKKKVTCPCCGRVIET